jgi:hypothetical protein
VSDSHLGARNRIVLLFEPYRSRIILDVCAIIYYDVGRMVNVALSICLWSIRCDDLHNPTEMINDHPFGVPLFFLAEKRAPIVCSFSFLSKGIFKHEQHFKMSKEQCINLAHVVTSECPFNIMGHSHGQPYRHWNRVAH